MPSFVAAVHVHSVPFHGPVSHDGMP